MPADPRLFLDTVRRRDGFEPPDDFPFSLPVIRSLYELHFTTPVTFFVGENGSGKSTLLEAIAAGVCAVAAGSADISRDPTLAAARALAAGLVFVRRRHAKRKMFFRAEDAFGFTKRLIDEMAALQEEEDALRADLPDGSWGQRLATGAVRGQRTALAERYGDDPDAASHGESFLALLSSRLNSDGLYLLDEPETPLSPGRVLALMSLMKSGVVQGCQFIVATHSPILMAFPGARLLRFGKDGLEEVAWTEVEHVRVTRAFLANPDRYIRDL